MSPGVATPCPAAPPIPIAKVCFMAPSQAECGRPTAFPALGRAQIKVWIPAIETPPPNDQPASPMSRSIHPILRHILASWRFDSTARTRVSTKRRVWVKTLRYDFSFHFLRSPNQPKLSWPLPIWRLFLFASKEHTLSHENQQASEVRPADASHSRR